jgi:hypothetical protein
MKSDNYISFLDVLTCGLGAMLLLFTIMIALTPKMNFKPPQPKADQQPFIVSVELPDFPLGSDLEFLVSGIGNGFEPDLVPGNNFALLFSRAQLPEESRIVIKGLESIQHNGGESNTVQIIFHHRHKNTTIDTTVGELSNKNFVIWPQLQSQD